MPRHKETAEYRPANSAGYLAWCSLYEWFMCTSHVTN